MIKNFSYPLPDEIYINSFTENKKISLRYDGPEKINVLVDKNINNICGIDPETYDHDIYNLIEVDANEYPEICYFLLNSPNNNGNIVYEDEIMENGDIYKKNINPTIHDVYEIVYDKETNTFKLDLIVKESNDNFLTSSLDQIKNRLNFIILNEEGKREKQEELSISEPLLVEISEVILNIDNFLKENNSFMSWKYTNFDTVVESFFPIEEHILELIKNYQ